MGKLIRIGELTYTMTKAKMTTFTETNFIKSDISFVDSY